MTESVTTGAGLRLLPLLPAGPRGPIPPVKPEPRQRPADAVNLSPLAKSANPTDPGLQAALLAAARKWNLADAGLVLTDLRSGKMASLNGTKVFSSASVIKLAVMAEVYRQVQAGKLRLDQLVTVRAGNDTDTWHPDGDRRPFLHAGSRSRVQELLELMITRSDNVATNTLLDLIGRQNLNHYMQALGASATQMHHKLSGGAIAVDDRGYDGGRNQTTARDMARLLALIAQERLVSPAASRAMLATLAGQLDNEKIPALLPPGTKVYHKTGETSHVTHDVAIVAGAGRRYVLAVLTDRPPGADTDHRIAGLARDLNSQLR